MPSQLLNSSDQYLRPLRHYRVPKQCLEYVLDTDATESQISACSQQCCEHSVLHPIGYCSRQLSPTERHYHISEKEAYAVYWAVKLLRPYLEGNRLTVRTDHSTLTWLLNADGNSTPRLTRWRLGLAQFDFVVKYRPGVRHQPADGVSRLVTLGHDSSAVEDEIPCCVVADDATKESVPTPEPTLEDAVLEPITPHELIDAQAQDPFCLSKLSDLDEATMKRHFAVNDKGLLVRLSPLEDSEQVVVPVVWLTVSCVSRTYLDMLLILVILACILPSVSHSIGLLWPKISISLSRIVRRAPKVVSKGIAGQTILSSIRPHNLWSLHLWIF
jgi:hypothetical protein